MPPINYLAVLAAAASSFLLGGIWYGALFARPWQAAAGLSDEQLKARNLPLVFGGSFVLALLGAFVFAMFLGPSPSLAFGAGAGFGAGLAWVAGSFAINYLFEARPLRLLLINGGYHTLQYTLIGAVLGALS